MSEIKVNNRQYDKEYLQGCADSSKRDDKAYGNGDGKLSAEEFQASFMSTNASVFANNDNYKAYADDLVNANSELFKTYAGEDGILDDNEKANMLNSKEYDTFINQWRNLSDAMEQDNEDAGFYLDNLDKHGNGDGVATTEEFLEYQMQLYQEIFKDNKDLLKSAQDLAKNKYENMKKYADENGVIDKKAYMSSLNSEENNKLNDKYWQLRDEQDKRSQASNPIGSFFQNLMNSLGSMFE